MNHQEKTAALFGTYETPRRFVAAKGDRIDGFEILEQLGEGTFGTVYKVRDHQGKVLALKVIKLWEVAFEKERRAIISRFGREFEIASIASKHLVRSYGYGKVAGNPYITMEYCDGGSLSSWIGRFGQHPQYKHIACKILRGLGELHSKGYFHRDIKPQNILMKGNGDAYLTDFGIAGQKNNRLTVTNIFGKVEQIFGTWAYLAPEQANNKVAFKAMDAVTDIFSFGVMMFELFTGSYPFPPFAIESERDLVEYLENAKKGNYSNIAQKAHLLPGPWADVIRRCLDPDYQHKRINKVEIILQLLGYSEHKETVPPPCPSSGSFGLQVTYGEDMHRVYNLARLHQETRVDILTLGRKDPSLTNDIEITELQTTFISRRHATLEKWADPAGWIMRDGQWTGIEWQPSLNHIYVNSRRIGQAGVPLQAGDIITLGDTVLRVVLLSGLSENLIVTS